MRSVEYHGIVKSFDLYFKRIQILKKLFSRESISVVQAIMARNGNESMDCKLFEVDHNDISCENFDIVATNEICNGDTVSSFFFIFSTS